VDERAAKTQGDVVVGYGSSETVEEKRRCYREWHRTKKETDKATYMEPKRVARRAVAKAQEFRRQKFASELESEEGKKTVFRVAKQMAKERQAVVAVNCLKNAKGNKVIEYNKVKDVWQKYMEKLLNEENEWDNNVECEKTQGPSCRITTVEVEQALKNMKNGKAAGQTSVVTEMLKAANDVGIEWLTDLCNLIVCEGEVYEHWKSSVLIPVYKGKGDPLECWCYRAIKLLEYPMKVVEKSQRASEN